MIPSFPTPPPFFPALVALVRPYCRRGGEAVAIAALEAWEACTGSFPSALEGEECDVAYYWLRQVERIASLGDHAGRFDGETGHLLRHVYTRDGVEVDDVPAAVMMLIRADIAEGGEEREHSGTLRIGGVVWGWE